MARSTVNVMKVRDVNTPAAVGTYSAMLTAPNSTDGAEVTLGKDHKTILLLVNDGSSQATATIKAGNGIGGANDLTVTLAAGKYTILVLDSSRFKNVSGNDRGKVIVTGGVKLAAFEGP